MARLYGISGDDLRGAQAHLERALTIRFEEHDSAPLGPYALHQGPVLRLHLRPNISPVTGEFAEPEHPDCGLLLHVEGDADLDALGLRLIRKT